ncbi:MAG: hypothetical protein O3A02_04645 [bacterium]|nr:hypothetical protein [bacterium]
MTSLTHDRYQHARAFLVERGRPLERRAFEHGFEGAPAWPVLDALAGFQNPDGGFGHGLEPDALTGVSGALATSVALHRLAEVVAGADHPMVQRAVAYLEQTLDPATRVWRIVPEATADAPHAPWWAAAGLEERFHGFTLNPKADLVAQLYALGPAADERWLDGLAEDVVREVEARPAAGLEMHDLIGVAQLLDAPHLSPALRRRLLDLVTPLAEAAVGRHPDDWAGYGLKPLALASRPDAALAGVLGEPLQRQLDHLIATQADDGAWWPQWSWGEEGADAVAWAESRTAWAGMLTLDALRQLRAFGRLAATDG